MQVFLVKVVQVSPLSFKGNLRGTTIGGCWSTLVFVGKHEGFKSSSTCRWYVEVVVVVVWENLERTGQALKWPLWREVSGFLF